MKKLKIFKCWITRHHWLIKTKTRIEGNLYRYRYECTYCGWHSKILVKRIDSYPLNNPPNSNITQ